MLLWTNNLFLAIFLCCYYQYDTLFLVHTPLNKLSLNFYLLFPQGVLSWCGKGCSSSWRARKVQREAHESEIYHQQRCSSFATGRRRHIQACFLWSGVALLHLGYSRREGKQKTGREGKTAEQEAERVAVADTIWFLDSSQITFWLLIYVRFKCCSIGKG